MKTYRAAFIGCGHMTEAVERNGVFFNLGAQRCMCADDQGSRVP